MKWVEVLLVSIIETLGISMALGIAGIAIDYTIKHLKHRWSEYQLAKQSRTKKSLFDRMKQGLKLTKHLNTSFTRQAVKQSKD